MPSMDAAIDLVINPTQFVSYIDSALELRVTRITMPHHRNCKLRAARNVPSWQLPSHKVDPGLQNLLIELLLSIFCIRPLISFRSRVMLRFHTCNFGIS
jgi:hypothetical protein